MVNNEKLNKLTELTKRAVSINEELLQEEKKFIEAVENEKSTRFLKRLSDKIRRLVRKESLYIGATHSLLQRLTNTK